MSEQPAVASGHIPPQDLRDDDGLLDFTTRRRLSFLDSITLDNSTDPKVMSLYLKGLDGIDKTATFRKRLKVDEQQAETDKEVSTHLGTMLRRMGSTNPFTVEAQQKRMRDFDEAEHELPAVEFVPGETHMGTENESYADFAKKFPDVLPQ